ncbi:ABC transporter substrate-binding protein [Aliivibrio wodanis]|uniref:ABC transporter substrate-binding protein n=1 Tax=Aliivibrio wodanis TaxID=80852 RepID=UPI00406C0E7F
MKTCLLVMLTLFSNMLYAGKVLVIESYHAEYSWDKSYLAGINLILDGEHEITTFQMNTKRLPSEQHEKMADKAYLKYATYQPDLVILGDDNALNYMLPKLYDKGIPIVFLGINANPRKLLEKYRGSSQITGVLEQPLLAKTMGEIGSMLPVNKKKIRVLFDSGTTSKIATSYMKQQYKMLNKKIGLEAEVIIVSHFSDWQSLILDADSQGIGAVVIGLYHTLMDENGIHVNEDTVISWTNKESKVPLFGFWDFSIGEGKAAGGVVLFGESQGIAAGEIAQKILSGKALAKDIPITIGRKGKAIYTLKEMKRWDLTPPKHWKAIE